MSVHILYRPRRKRYILKLHKAHRSVDLLPKTHPLESLTPTEQRSQRFLQEVRRMCRRRYRGEIPNVKRIDLCLSKNMRHLRQQGECVKTYRWILVCRISCPA